MDYKDSNDKIKCWMGLDCGSVSIKLALIDKNKKLIDSIYLKNQGLIETIQKGLSYIYKEEYLIAGVGCTGSGRQFTSMLLGADVVKTEILAHTIATLHYYPKVRTIMDIGGEDCKIMNVTDGILTNFIMNNICGAGTGAVIETIASRLGTPIEEVGELAMQSKEDLEFPGKCGVFCQSAVVNKLNSGANKSDILKGVLRALINNYLALAKGIELVPPYVFQGATAQNKALVRVLEEQLKHKVIIPKECAIMGAIGAALLAMEANIKETKYKGFNINKFNFNTKNFRCHDCPNRCEVTQLYENEKLIGCLGSRCEKWNYKEFKQIDQDQKPNFLDMAKN
jgi:predicted CoA-substrate-specific enzyme activase